MEKMSTAQNPETASSHLSERGNLLWSSGAVQRDTLEVRRTSRKLFPHLVVRWFVNHSAQLTWHFRFPDLRWLVHTLVCNGNHWYTLVIRLILSCQGIWYTSSRSGHVKMQETRLGKKQQILPTNCQHHTVSLLKETSSQHRFLPLPPQTLDLE